MLVKNINLKRRRLRGCNFYRWNLFLFMLLICTSSQDPFSGPWEGQVVLEKDFYLIKTGRTSFLLRFLALSKDT